VSDAAGRASGPSSGPLAHQVAVVTGASRGIGRGVALALARAGADVALAARDETALAAVAREIEASGRAALAVPTDVRDAAQIDRLARAVLDRFGRVDILINNAGLGHFGPVDALPVEQFDEMIAVNLRGPFLCTRAFVPAMKAQGGGAIVNVASVAGLVGNPNLSGYNASKFGLMGFSEATMLELRHAGIKVIVICPGSTATDFGAGRDPVGRLTVDDVAHAVLGALTASPNALQSQIHLRPLHPPKR
jgi:NAD(P)-dependent dehydrogenase (short-subunit alcohol dehydrogenase family)